LSTATQTGGLVTWAREVLPALNGGYAYLIESKGSLPDVVVELLSTEVALADDRFPYSQIQQRYIRTWDYEFSFMVNNDDTALAAGTLEDWSDTLLTAASSDVTLGGRVGFISPFISFDFTPPFVEYPDGTRGREMRMLLAVGELVEGTQ
jgi:hypothetical protein